MGEHSKIEWTDHTFNPWVGCEKVSEGCANCYAERDMTRKPRWAKCWGPPESSERLRTSEAYWKKPFTWNRKAQKAGVPARVFCASLADVFEDNQQVEGWREELFKLIASTRWLNWQILTKRPEMAAEYFRRHPYMLATNIQMGVSVEDQESANQRVRELLSILSRVLFLSVEPMLGPIDLVECGAVLTGVCRGINWVIVGCESGPKRRPLYLMDVYRLVRQCREFDVPVFIKQLDIGGRVSKEPDEWPEGLRIREFPDV